MEIYARSRRWEPNIVINPLLGNVKWAKEGHDDCDGTRKRDNNMEEEKEERNVTTNLNKSHIPSTSVVSPTSLLTRSRSEGIESPDKMHWEPPDGEVHLKMSHWHSMQQE